MSSLVIKAEVVGQALQLTCEGQIDEASVYPKLPRGTWKRLELDLAKVQLINSTGLQRWIGFLGSVPGDLTLTRCSLRVIAQLNMFPGFLAGKAATVASFYAPYFCEACDASLELLLETATDFPDPERIKAPTKVCPRCQGVAEFDGIEKKYFLFLKSALPVTSLRAS